MLNATLYDENEEFDTLLLEVEQRQLVLFNDDVNSFDDVIRWLVEICNHESLQAEQCAYIVHYAGKCSVKTGTWEDLQPRAIAMLDRGLSVEIV
jgi:ATP-dependent Clp protease adaptor protein ClpS